MVTSIARFTPLSVFLLVLSACHTGTESFTTSGTGASISPLQTALKFPPFKQQYRVSRPGCSNNNHQRKGRCHFSRSNSRIPLSSGAASTASSSTHQVDGDSLEDQYDPNDITPPTKTIYGSMAFFAQFVVETLVKNRLKKKEKELSNSLRKRVRGERRKSFFENMAQLNEQRKNLVILAGYNARIVIPSFGFLFLGALTTSIVPLYESKCIQLVATLHPTKAKVVEALIGLVVSSTLASLFTGLRGSLFWLAGRYSSADRRACVFVCVCVLFIGCPLSLEVSLTIFISFSCHNKGSRANYNIRVKLHRSLLLQEAAFFDSNEVGYLLSRLNNDVNKIGNVISYHVNVVCRQLAQFIFGSVVLWRISRQLAMWTFAGVGLVAILSAIYGEFARTLAEETQNAFADSTAVAETSLSMSETIRSFNGVEIDSKKYEQSQGLALELEEVQAFAYGSHKVGTVQGILLLINLIESKLLNLIECGRSH